MKMVIEMTLDDGSYMECEVTTGVAYQKGEFLNGMEAPTGETYAEWNSMGADTVKQLVDSLQTISRLVQELPLLGGLAQ